MLYVLFAVIMKKKTLVCQFASPLDVDIHSKPEVSGNFNKINVLFYIFHSISNDGCFNVKFSNLSTFFFLHSFNFNQIMNRLQAVVLEGKYWKRQFDVIKAEYMKWRKFYRNRGLGNNAILDTVR